MTLLKKMSSILLFATQLNQAKKVIFWYYLANKKNLVLRSYLIPFHFCDSSTDWSVKTFEKLETKFVFVFKLYSFANLSWGLIHICVNRTFVDFVFLTFCWIFLQQKLTHTIGTNLNFPRIQKEGCCGSNRWKKF